MKEIHEHGHRVLRLPVHCELNLIELAWASVKGYVAKHNKKYTLAEVEQLTPEGFEHTTKDMWRHFCRHVVDVENDYIKKDGILEVAVEEMIIEIGPDDDDSDEDEEDMLDDDDRVDSFIVRKLSLKLQVEEPAFLEQFIYSVLTYI